jgi:hypothetical protein
MIPPTARIDNNQKAGHAEASSSHSISVSQIAN